MYNIDENLAKQAKESNSFDGTATMRYNGYLDRFNKRVAKLIADYPQNINDDVLSLVEYYKDRYAKKLAFAINKSNSIEARKPKCFCIDWKERKLLYGTAYFYKECDYKVVRPKFVINEYGSIELQRGDEV